MSFNFDDDEDAEDEKQFEILPLKKKRMGMDPNVDTFFLPDHEREKELIRFYCFKILFFNMYLIWLFFILLFIIF